MTIMSTVIEPTAVKLLKNRIDANELSLTEMLFQDVKDAQEFKRIKDSAAGFSKQDTDVKSPHSKSIKI